MKKQIGLIVFISLVTLIQLHIFMKMTMAKQQGVLFRCPIMFRI